MISQVHTCYASSHIAHNTRALMPKDSWEHPLWIGTRQGKLIRVANAGRHNFHQHLASARTVKIDLHDFQWLACLNSNCSSCLHLSTPPTFHLTFARG